MAKSIRVHAGPPSRPQLARWILLLAVVALAAAGADRAATPAAATAPPAAASAGQPAPPAAARPDGLYARNLIANGDAEAAGVPPSSWEVINGDLQSVQYGAAGSFPGPTSPGPPDRGARFFGGGSQPTTIGGQAVDISSIAAAVDAGKVTYRVSGYFGGFADEADTAFLEINFQDASHFFVDQVLIGSPTPAERQNITGLILKSAQGTLPATTRFLQIRVHMDRVSGATNDGYADNLALVLLGPGTQAYIPRIIR